MIFKEYKEEEDKLFNYTPWGFIVKTEKEEGKNIPGIIVNKDGNLQITIKFRGEDLDSSIDEMLDLKSFQINSLFKRLGEEYSYYIEARRINSKEYDSSEKNLSGVLKEMEKERRRSFTGLSHFESEYYLTLLYTPPRDRTTKLQEFYIDKEKSKDLVSYEILENFIQKVQFFYEEFSLSFIETKVLDPEETLIYLHSCISDNPLECIKIPETTTMLDYYLYDSELLGGLEPKLGDRYMAVLTINNFPDLSYSGILDTLNRLPVSYRWSTRFIPLGKQEALKTLKSYHRKWFAGRLSFFQLISEVFSEKETVNVNRDALNKAEEVQQEIEAVEGDYVSIGYYTSTIILLDKNKEKLNENSNLIKKAINSLGFIVKVENLNSVHGYLGSLPGNIYYNVRQPLLNSLNFVNLLPTTAVWQGNRKNKHFNDKCLLTANTTGSTPFYLNLHQGDVGHTMVIGPTGAGKSVLLNTLTSNWFKYKNAKIFTFDKGGSSRVLAKGVKGTFYDLGNEENIISFQPLRNVDRDIEWCQNWLEEIFFQEKIQILPEDKENIYNALLDLKNTPKDLRTLSSFMTYLQDERLRLAIKPYTNKGVMGKYFDSDRENFNLADFYTVFEMENIADKKNVITPVLSYLFHRIEDSLKGDPTLIILDECWLFFSNEQFEQKIKEWLKVLRKKNTSVVFATQELSDIINSNIADTIRNSCKTKLLLPDPLAKQNKELYIKFGLNAQEIEIVANAIQKREYYYKSEKGNRLFELGLSALELAFLASSSVEDQEYFHKIKELETKDFLKKWLEYKKIEVGGEAQ